MATKQGLCLLKGPKYTHLMSITISLLVISALCLESVQARRLRTNTSDCPDGCFCNTISKIVYCARRGLTAMPRSIPAGSLQLNSNGNAFEVTTITRSNLTSFASLEHLYLSECNIQTIEVGAFQDLVNLQWLDLSHNRISRVESHTFIGLSILHLFLNGNRNLRLGPSSFADMQTTGLHLHECSFSKLSFDVFQPLNGTLELLRLDANELETIDKKFITLFSTLTHLRLGQNPLLCNCQSQWLKELFNTRARIFEGAEEPSCLSPPKLRGKKFNEISLQDFTCVSPVFKNIDAVLENNRGILTCRATAEPAPTLYWIAPTGISTKYPPHRDGGNYNEAVLDISDHIIAGHDFSGQYFCLAINEGGNMTFTFNVSWPSYAFPKTSASVPSTTTLPTTTTTTQHIAIDGINRMDDNGDSHSSEIDLNHLYEIQKPPDDSDKNTQNNMADDNSRYVTSRNNAQQKSNNSVKQINTRGRYNLAELIGAIVGTFLCTVLICLIVIPLILRRKWYKSKHKSIEKPPLKEEPVYMAPTCNHYTGKLTQPYRSYSREYYFDNSNGLITR